MAHILQLFLLPEVFAAGVAGLLGIVGAAVAGAMAVLVGKRFIDAEALRRKLDIAMDDIVFLLTVEAIHAETHKSGVRKSLRSVRKEAMNAGLKWSGKFTASQQRKHR